MKGWLKRGLAGFGLALVVLVAVLVIRTLTFGSVQRQVAPLELPQLDAQAMAQRLSGAIQLKTISSADREKFDQEPFLALHAYLEAQYPKVHATLKRERFEALSLLYTWEGSDPSLPPLLLLAHMDVVPVEPGTEARWEHPPFSGAVADGFVWGRGAMDDKIGVLGTLEAVERLLGEGFAPRRTIILAFGHDEEVEGSGARAMAGALEERGVKALMALDEGLMITDGIVPGLAAPAALVGISEKGFVSLELTAQVEGGHSSTPPAQTAVGVLARAVVAVEEHPLPSRLDGPAREMFMALGPEMPFGQRLAFANLWLLEPVVRAQLEKGPATNATIRTTTAPTMLEGSPQDNVLPSLARGVINFRILPGDTSDGVKAHVEAAIDDPRVTVRKLGGLGDEPSPVSATDSEGFEALERAVREVFPEALVSPALMIGATDGRHYRKVAQDIYRFTPQRLTPEDRPRFHGTNERLRVEDLTRGVLFYRQLILNTCGQPAP